MQNRLHHIFLCFSIFQIIFEEFYYIFFSSGGRWATSRNARRLLSTSSRCLAVTPPPKDHNSAKQSFDEFRAQEEQKEKEFDSNSSTTTESPKSEKINDEEMSVKLRVLEAALPLVATHSWSKIALAKGAETIGLPGVAHGMFPRGGAEIIDYYNAQCNEQLIEYMKKLEAETNKDPPTKFVEKAIQTRLRMLVPYIPQWPQALAIMTMPPNVPTALSNLLAMVDDICFYAGDRSVDVSQLELFFVSKIYEIFFLCF